MRKPSECGKLIDEYGARLRQLSAAKAVHITAGWSEMKGALEDRKRVIEKKLLSSRLGEYEQGYNQGQYSLLSDMLESDEAIDGRIGEMRKRIAELEAEAQEGARRLRAKSPKPESLK